MCLSMNSILAACGLNGLRRWRPAGRATTLSVLLKLHIYGTEMAVHVLAYNLKRVMNIMGIGPLIAAMNAA